MARSGMAPPKAPQIRFRVEPGDVPAEKAARRLHLTPAAFDAVKTRLYVRGFPRPDPDTGMYDLEAIDRWRHMRHPSLFPELKLVPDAVPPQPVKTLGDLSREAQEHRQAERRTPPKRA